MYKNLLKAIAIVAILVSNSFGALDFNKASFEELVAIKGIGEKKAKSIIEYRKKHKITNLEQLLNVKGIGEKLLVKIKESTK